MLKHVVTVAGVGLSALFVAVFFASHTATRPLAEVAPHAGMSYEELMAMGPRVAGHTGATLGTSRHVIYLLACSGRTGRSTIEEQAIKASALVKRERLSDREAVAAVLGERSISAGSLRDC
ncbi:MAG: hypothetical protein ABIP61_01890 [Burkholderiaceae bacterium]